MRLRNCWRRGSGLYSVAILMSLRIWIGPAEPPRRGVTFGRKVEWPTSKHAYAVGLVDSYRIVHGDEVRRPGLTWTPHNESEFEVHDRIDILYHGGEGIWPVEARVVGARDDQSDVVVAPYPSDHRAVVVEYRLR